jgi:chromosome partitioning protein
VIPRAAALQEAARFHAPDRSYFAKYPGGTGQAIRGLTEELLQRMAAPPRAEIEPPIIPVAEATDAA